jgi:hypothetical protein
LSQRFQSWLAAERIVGAKSKTIEELNKPVNAGEQQLSKSVLRSASTNCLATPHSQSFGENAAGKDGGVERFLCGQLA